MKRLSGSEVGFLWVGCATEGFDETGAVEPDPVLADQAGLSVGEEASVVTYLRAATLRGGGE
ncbi:MAG: hypothetical protein AAGC74_13040 [Verrucomicrobiota bacterium]